MKIVQVNHIILDGGGREEVVYQLSKGLVEHGHDVTILSSDYLPSGEETIGQKIKKIPGLKLSTLKGYRTEFPPGRIHIPDLLDYLMQTDCDIIHAHGMGEQAAEEAMFVANVKKIPFVYTPHLHPAWTYEKLDAQKIWQVLQTTLTPMIINNSAACIAVSPNQKDDIMRYTGVSNRNLRVISNGVEGLPEPVASAEIEKVFSDYGIPSAENYIIFLGDLSNPRKGAFEAVQAFRQVRQQLPNTHLILVGPWSHRLRMSPQSFQLINKMAKARHVTLTGYADNRAKAALLTKADVFISPTVFEAFGIAIAESLYYGTPVVATRIGGIPFVVRDRKHGLLVKDNDNIAGFAQACVSLLKDKPKARRMGLAGQRRIRKLFNWKKTVDKTISLYERILKK